MAAPACSPPGAGSRAGSAPPARRSCENSTAPRSRNAPGRRQGRRRLRRTRREKTVRLGVDGGHPLEAVADADRERPARRRGQRAAVAAAAVAEPAALAWLPLEHG